MPDVGTLRNRYLLTAAFVLVAVGGCRFDGKSEQNGSATVSGADSSVDVEYGPILNLRRDTDGGWTTREFATGFAHPVDGARGSDGSFYILEYGRALKRIVYRGVSS